MATKYAIQYNDGNLISKERFDSIEDAKQHLFNNGYHLIEGNGFHEKFWATLNFDTNMFDDENIEIIEIETYNSVEVARELLNIILRQNINYIFKNVSGCQNCITLKINNQMFRIIVEEVAT